MSHIEIYTTNNNLADKISKTLAIHCVSTLKPSHDNWYLEMEQERLTLFGVLEDNSFQLSFDLMSGSMNYRRKHGGGRKEPLAKAVGLKHNATPFVIDATAGMGREAFLLANLGCRVHAIERIPITYLLLQNAIQRLFQEGTSVITQGQLMLHFADSIEYLEKLRPIEYPEVIYLDPMFPEREKSAAVKKEMRIFKRLAGADLDDQKLLAVSLLRATKRVVVKRPACAPFVGNRAPSFQIESKKHRFDVYLTD